MKFFLHQINILHSLVKKRIEELKVWQEQEQSPDKKEMVLELVRDSEEILNEISHERKRLESLSESDYGAFVTKVKCEKIKKKAKKVNGDEEDRARKRKLNKIRRGYSEVIEVMNKNVHKSSEKVAKALNNKGLKTANGHKWTAIRVNATKSNLKRLGFRGVKRKRKKYAEREE